MPVNARHFTDSLKTTSGKRDMVLLKDAENTTYGACKQRGSFMENEEEGTRILRIRIVTFGTYNKEIRLRNMTLKGQI